MSERSQQRGNLKDDGYGAKCTPASEANGLADERVEDGDHRSTSINGKSHM
ncbi:hypothetical protein GPY37_23250 [Photorhabdus kayaii]|uniref:Uncharacterized protein n=1 Tax=Photorhabdus kayaii TaxID=230088 RepID=A0ABX0B4B3_9GAMM|nr:MULTISPECIES: hypothetical protein [Photorhabdus]MCC8376745.1 hypothetical protein [Photorhabdus bodei]NDL14481.1 hypothetical protein [Photorhabdus kayaii]NDL27931.1 hypothetical protein [Photorhabdus kayaii]